MTGAQLIDVQALKQLIPQLIALAIALGHGSWGSARVRSVDGSRLELRS